MISEVEPLAESLPLPDVYRCANAQGYTRTDALLRAGGLTGTYEGWLAQWEATFAEFEEHSRRDWSEFSMTDVATAFLNQVGLSSDDDAVADLVAIFLDEWNAGVVDIEGLRATLGYLPATASWRSSRTPTSPALFMVTSHGWASLTSSTTWSCPSRWGTANHTR